MSTRAEDHDPAVMRVVPNWAAVSALISLLVVGGAVGSEGSHYDQVGTL